MGTPRGTMFFRVFVPAAAPELFAGARIGLAHCFVLLFAAELIGLQGGVGALIVEGDDAVAVGHKAQLVGGRQLHQRHAAPGFGVDDRDAEGGVLTWFRSQGDEN